MSARAIRPIDHAVFSAEKMGKATLFRSERVLVGLNCFEPGQEHRLHTHAGQDKVYHVLSGTGVFLLEDGDFYAIDDLCTHGEVSLSEGEVVGCFVECFGQVFVRR